MWSSQKHLDVRILMDVASGHGKTVAMNHVSQCEQCAAELERLRRLAACFPEVAPVAPPTLVQGALARARAEGILHDLAAGRDPARQGRSLRLEEWSAPPERRAPERYWTAGRVIVVAAAIVGAGWATRQFLIPSLYNAPFFGEVMYGLFPQDAPPPPDTAPVVYWISTRPVLLWASHVTARVEQVTIQGDEVSYASGQARQQVWERENEVLIEGEVWSRNPAWVVGHDVRIVQSSPIGLEPVQGVGAVWRPRSQNRLATPGTPSPEAEGRLPVSGAPALDAGPGRLRFRVEVPATDRETQTGTVRDVGIEFAAARAGTEENVVLDLGRHPGGRIAGTGSAGSPPTTFDVEADPMPAAPTGYRRSFTAATPQLHERVHLHAFEPASSVPRESPLLIAPGWGIVSAGEQLPKGMPLNGRSPDPTVGRQFSFSLVRDRPGSLPTGEKLYLSYVPASAMQVVTCTLPAISLSRAPGR